VTATTQTAGEVHELALGSARFPRPCKQGDLHGFRPAPVFHRLLGEVSGDLFLDMPETAQPFAKGIGPHAWLADSHEAPDALRRAKRWAESRGNRRSLPQRAANVREAHPADRFFLREGHLDAAGRDAPVFVFAPDPSTRRRRVGALCGAGEGQPLM